MQNLEVLNGWFIAPSPTDGTPVPMFIKVRAKDIDWAQSSIEFPPAFKAIIPESGTELLAPVVLIRFLYNDWFLTLYTDYTYQATRRLHMEGSGFHLTREGDYSEINKVISLPFYTLDDAHLNAEITMSADNRDIITAFPNAIFLTDGTNLNYLTVLDLHLINPVSGFDNEYEENGVYSNSTINISISGKVYVDPVE